MQGQEIKWANIPGLILLNGEPGGDLGISNPDLHGVNNGDEGISVPMLVIHKTVEPPANITAVISAESSLPCWKTSRSEAELLQEKQFSQGLLTAFLATICRPKQYYLAIFKS